MRAQHGGRLAGLVATACLAASTVSAAIAPPVGAASPGVLGLRLARGLVRSLSAAPPYARLALPSEHRVLAALAVSFLLFAAAVEARARRRHRPSGARRSLGAPTRGVAMLDVTSAAGHRRVPLDRARAHPVEDAEGHLVAQVVWSREHGWCAQASWPHRLCGPAGEACLTARLEPGVWLHVAGVRLGMHSGAPHPTAARQPKPLRRAL